MFTIIKLNYLYKEGVIMNIGAKIKQLRSLCGLTQEELANRCELTKGYISQIENDLTSPTIATLNDILIALGTNMSDFFKLDHEEKVVFTKDDYVVKTDDKVITWLVPNSQKNEMEPILLQLPSNTSTDVDMPHEGQEFGFVVDGEIILVIDKKEHVCKKGESFYFTTDKNHYIKNNKNKDAKVIWISSPPNF